MLYQNGFGLVSFYQQSPVFAIGNFPFLLLLVAGLAQQLEHVALIELHTGLIEGIHVQNIGGDTAAQLQEEEQFAHLPVVQLPTVHGDHGHAAVHMGSQSAQVSLLVHKVQGLALQVIQAVQILIVALDGTAPSRRSYR